MADVSVDLKSVEVIKGQGASGGNLDLNVKVQEGPNKVHWPAPYPATQTVDQGGALVGIGKQIGTYTVASSTKNKLFNVSVTEKDQGTLDQDNIGRGGVTFELRDGMPPTLKAATISLKRSEAGSSSGQIKVVLSAQQI